MTALPTFARWRVLVLMPGGRGPSGVLPGPGDLRQMWTQQGSIAPANDVGAWTDDASGPERSLVPSESERLREAPQLPS